MDDVKLSDLCQRIKYAVMLLFFIFLVLVFAVFTKTDSTFNYKMQSFVWTIFLVVFYRLRASPKQTTANRKMQSSCEDSIRCVLRIESSATVF